MWFPKIADNQACQTRVIPASCVELGVINKKDLHIVRISKEDQKKV